MLVATHLGYDRTFLWSDQQQNNLVAIQPQIIQKLLEKFIAVHGTPVGGTGTLVIVYEFFVLWANWVGRYSAKKNKGKDEGLLQAYRHGRRKDEKKFIKMYERFCLLVTKIAPVFLADVAYAASVVTPLSFGNADAHEYDAVLEGLTTTFGVHASITHCYSDARRVFYEEDELTVRPYLLAHLMRDLTDLFLGQFISLRKGKAVQSDFIPKSLDKVVKMLELGDRVDVGEWIAIYRNCVSNTHLDVTQDALLGRYDMDTTWHTFNRLLLNIFGTEKHLHSLLDAILRSCGITSPSSREELIWCGYYQPLAPSQAHVFRSLLDFALLRDERFSYVLSQRIVVSEELWTIMEKKCILPYHHHHPHQQQQQQQPPHTLRSFHRDVMVYLAKLLNAKAEEALLLKNMKEKLKDCLTSKVADGGKEMAHMKKRSDICKRWDCDLLHEIIAGVIRFINKTIKGKDTRPLKQAVIEEMSRTFGGMITLPMLTHWVASEDGYPNTSNSTTKGKGRVDPRALERFLLASNFIDEFGIVRVNPLRLKGKKQRLNMKKFKVEEAPLEAFLARVHDSRQCVLERLVGADVMSFPSLLPAIHLISDWMTPSSIGAAIQHLLPPPSTTTVVTVDDDDVEGEDGKVDASNSNTNVRDSLMAIIVDSIMKVVVAVAVPSSSSPAQSRMNTAKEGEEYASLIERSKCLLDGLSTTPNIHDMPELLEVQHVLHKLSAISLN